MLHLKGVALGKIKRMAQNKGHPWYIDCGSGLQYWMQTLFGDSIMDDQSETYVTGEPYFRAFWRAAAVDCAAYPIRRLNSKELDEEDSKVVGC